MKTKEFLAALEQYPTLELDFQYAKGEFVRPDFHLTEIKNADFATVDCGGQKNQWKETIVQLWENPIEEPEHRVNIQKALDIFKMVDKITPIDREAEIKFEYGNPRFHATQMGVLALRLEIGKRIIVDLGMEFTTCKAKDRATTEAEKASACCGPSSDCCS